MSQINLDFVQIFFTILVHIIYLEQRASMPPGDIPSKQTRQSLAFQTRPLCNLAEVLQLPNLSKTIH